MTKRLLAIATVMALATLALAACGGGDDAGDDTTTTTAATTTTGGTTATTMATTTTAGTTATTAGGGDGAQEFTVTAMNVLFDTNRIEVKAGQEVKITFVNADLSSDEPHNIHFRTDTEDWFTAIKGAPNTEELVFTPSHAGTFTFFCDTHTATMVGEFIVTG